MDAILLIVDLMAIPSVFILKLYILAVALVFAGELFLVGSKKVHFKAMMARKYMDVKANHWLSGSIALAVIILINKTWEPGLICWAMFAWYLESQWKAKVLYWYNYSMGFPEGVERTWGYEK